MERYARGLFGNSGGDLLFAALFADYLRRTRS